LYFTEAANISQLLAEFDHFETQHIVKSMRRNIGERINFTDGRGTLYEGQISALRPKLHVICSVLKQLEWPPPWQSILGIGFIRPSRMDFLIEKATELGITRFLLFASRYTNYFTPNSERWEKITRQAIKQSNRLYLPEISIIKDFPELIDTVSGIKYKYIADQQAAQQVADIINKQAKCDDDIIIVIGPEGGLDFQEINLAKDKGFLPLTFGEHRLRTETAAISAASYISLLRN
jgi:16S rRNA (uracil1498-N3)-methyltransferase